MTFDEAIEKIEELQGSAGYATGGVPEANKFSGYDVHEYLNAATEIINELRGEYAPMIEMTKTQNEAFFESVEGIVTQKELDSFVNEEFELGDMTVRKGLTAWLHPETIKVVDE